MIYYGTNHFVDQYSALEYYRQYFDGSDYELQIYVSSKISAGDIAIGKPALKPGEKLLIRQGEGRYVIQQIEKEE